MFYPCGNRFVFLVLADPHPTPRWWRGRSPPPRRTKHNKHNKCHFTAEDAPKSKSWRKQTSFRIKFYIEIQVGGSQFWIWESGGWYHRALQCFPQPSPVPHQTHLDTKGLQLLPTTMPWNQQLLQTWRKTRSFRSQDSSLHHPTSFQPSSNVNLD